MTDIATLTPDELIARIQAKLTANPYESSYFAFDVAPAPTQQAVYALIVGAGFSYDVVPLVRELTHQTIGGYYYPDQEQSSLELPTPVLRRDSANFWATFNQEAEEAERVELNRKGLPEHPGAAYQKLFTSKIANKLFAHEKPKSNLSPWLDNVQRLRRLSSGLHSAEEIREERHDNGGRFVKGFLRYVMDPGSEHGYGSTGRNRLNPAHVYLAALLEAQQRGVGWSTVAFCRTILTTNFDTLLQNALQMVNLLYSLTDRPEKGIDRSEFSEEETAIHLVYTHGSILRHNPASTTDELSELANENVEVLRSYLQSHDVITIGYSGWNDGLMDALRRCDPSKHKLYWCDVLPQPAPHVANFLRERADSAAYVYLGRPGADGFMRTLYETIVPMEAQRDPMQRLRDWRDFVWGLQKSTD